MKKLILTIVDTSGIQGYVFGANNLQQNVGASYLADCASREWAVDALADLNHNVIDHHRCRLPRGARSDPLFRQNQLRRAPQPGLLRRPRHAPAGRSA